MDGDHVREVLREEVVDFPGAFWPSRAELGRVACIIYEPLAELYDDSYGAFKKWVDVLKTPVPVLHDSLEQAGCFGSRKLYALIAGVQEELEGIDEELNQLVESTDKIPVLALCLSLQPIVMSSVPLLLELLSTLTDSQHAAPVTMHGIALIRSFTISLAVLRNVGFLGGDLNQRRQALNALLVFAISACEWQTDCLFLFNACWEQRAQFQPLGQFTSCFGFLRGGLSMHWDANRKGADGFGRVTLSHEGLKVLWIPHPTLQLTATMATDGYLGQVLDYCSFLPFELPSFMCEKVWEFRYIIVPTAWGKYDVGQRSRIVTSSYNQIVPAALFAAPSGKMYQQANIASNEKDAVTKSRSEEIEGRPCCPAA